jgi:hypothetical protein
MIGDAVGSIGVMLSWAVVAYGGAWLGRWRFLADPLCSLGILAVILSTTLPILRQSSAILLNKAPEQVDVAALRRKILATPGVLDLHCLHVWNLTDDKVLGTCHVTASATGPAFVGPTAGGEGGNPSGSGSLGVMAVRDGVREAMCRAGVHVTTVQVEPLPLLPAGGELAGGSGVAYRCLDGVCEDPVCLTSRCCSPEMFV